MPEDFQLDAAALTRATAEVRETGRALGAQYDRLTAVLDDHHGCWGTDDIGQAFANGYGPPAAAAVTYGDQAVTGYTDIADDVDTANTTFQGVDEENARRIDATLER